VLDLQLRVGDPVAQDQRLFSIKSREVAALVTDYIQSQRDLDLAEKTHAMTQDLFDHQAASRIALQQAENDLAKTKTAIARAGEALSVIGLDPRKAGEAGALRALIPVFSPAAGTVIDRMVTVGQFVPADSTPLLTIADLSSVWVLVDVFERDIHLIRVGQTVQVTAVAYPERRFTALVQRIDDKVNAESRTLKVRLLVDNPEMLLKPEMFISASVEIGGGTSLSAPARAVFTEAGKSYVYVQTGPRTFERRAVNAAPRGAGRLHILSGLRPGDKVVTEGTLLVNQRQLQQQAPQGDRD
jgi:cobalt-zinc-cadmium efflux system membrane fusion protein